MRCPNKVRRWWSLWFKVRCRHEMVEVRVTLGCWYPGYDGHYCPICRYVTGPPPPHHPNCRCVS
jgi:hypothetical protein